MKMIHGILSKRLIYAISGGVLCSCAYAHAGKPSQAEADCESTKETGPATEPTTNGMILKNVQAFIRHGARTPLRHIPLGGIEVRYDKEFLGAILPKTEVPYIVRTIEGNPRPESRLQKRYNSVEFEGGCVGGMLTSTGRDQLYYLGSKFRQKYVDRLGFIQGKLDTSEVYSRSTNVTRCIQSLQCFLGGLFKASSFDENDPVVIQVAERPNEVLYPNITFCETLQVLEAQVKQMLTIGDFEKKIYKAIGYSGDDRIPMMAVRDHIISRQTHGLRVPKQVTDLLPEIAAKAVEEMVYFFAGTPENRTLVLQLTAGPMLHLVKDNMNKVINKEEGSHKMSLYCCHDSSLIPLLMGLGCFDQLWPPFAADVSFELYEDQNKQNWVQVLYCDKPMTLRGCGRPLITLEQFYDVIEPVETNPTDRKKRCSDMHAARAHAAAHEAVMEENIPGL